MSGPSQPPRGLAIAMVVLAALAFIGILVGLAMGQAAAAGACAVVLVVIWFALRAVQKRGARG